MAAALSEGVPVTAIAQSERVSPNTILSDAQSVEVRVLIDRLVDRYARRMEATFERCLNVIDEALGAERTLVLSQGKGLQISMPGGPDYFARLQAVKQFKDLCLANRPTPKHEETRKGTFTLDDLQEIERMLRGDHGNTRAQTTQ